MTPLRVLLVGDHEEDFFLIREMLERNRSLIAADLEHARTLEEASEMMQHRPYGLVLFEHDAVDAEALRLVTNLLHDGRPVPFILLTEDADEKTVADIIGGGTWNCLSKSRLDGATLVRTIHNTVALHSLQLEQQNAEESLRKLTRAVEQSADTVVITDCQGVIEYINPAFEALTGYSRDEAQGRLRGFLNLGSKVKRFIRKCGRRFSAERCFAGSW